MLPPSVPPPPPRVHPIIHTCIRMGLLLPITHTAAAAAAAQFITRILRWQHACVSVGRLDGWMTTACTQIFAYINPVHRTATFQIAFRILPHKLRRRTAHGEPGLTTIRWDFGGARRKLYSVLGSKLLPIRIHFLCDVQTHSPSQQGATCVCVCRRWAPMAHTHRVRNIFDMRASTCLPMYHQRFFFWLCVVGWDKSQFDWTTMGARVALQLR